MKGYVIAVLAVIAVVLLAAWFLTPSEHFKGVVAVCYGFLIGWLSAFLVAGSVYKKKL
jgi:hypothetical protein